MAVLKLRAYFEEDDSIYRDIIIKHTQTFADLHLAILKSYDFDNKHQATFYRSNDLWQRGREITFEKYDKPYKAEPLLMAETTIGSEMKDPSQKFIFTYDFKRGWVFLVELINVTKEESARISYPATSRSEGIGPAQYGTKSLLGDKFVDIEEKYDLSAGAEGFSHEGESDHETETDGDTDTETDELIGGTEEGREEEY